MRREYFNRMHARQQRADHVMTSLKAYSEEQTQMRIIGSSNDVEDKTNRFNRLVTDAVMKRCVL